MQSPGGYDTDDNGRDPSNRSPRVSSVDFEDRSRILYLSTYRDFDRAIGAQDDAIHLRQQLVSLLDGIPMNGPQYTAIHELWTNFVAVVFEAQCIGASKDQRNSKFWMHSSPAKQA